MHFPSFTARIGNLVYSLQKDGSVVVRHQPVRKRQESSPAQKAQQERFRKAILYARGVLKILELSAMYESTARKRGTLARELAMTAYYKGRLDQNHNGIPDFLEKDREVPSS